MHERTTCEECYNHRKKKHQAYFTYNIFCERMNNLTRSPIKKQDIEFEHFGLSDAVDVSYNRQEDDKLYKSRESIHSPQRMKSMF